MNDLIKVMASDMGIANYADEPSDSYIFRVIYSALGRWCLESARTDEGISKHGQTALLNKLTKKFVNLFPEIEEMLIQVGQENISVFIRRLYEETGFLLTNSSNYNRLANYHRGLQIGSKHLLYGLSKETCVDGLGIYSDDIEYSVSWRDVLLRDTLNCDEYVSSMFDLALFSPREITEDSLEYFNPITDSAPSSSWTNTMITEKTVARDLTKHVYYRVMRYNEEMLYCDDLPNMGTDGLTDYEYRRLYYAIKRHYGHSLKARVKIIDRLYSKISLGGHLPNREYYLMLLCSWPCRRYNNKSEFIIKNEYLKFIHEVFENIGIEMIGE